MTQVKQFKRRSRPVPVAMDTTQELKQLTSVSDALFEHMRRQVSSVVACDHTYDFMVNMLAKAFDTHTNVPWVLAEVEQTLFFMEVDPHNETNERWEGLTTKTQGLLEKYRLSLSLYQEKRELVRLMTDTAFLEKLMAYMRKHRLNDLDVVAGDHKVDGVRVTNDLVKAARDKFPKFDFAPAGAKRDLQL